MSDADDDTCARFALGEFPRGARALSEELPAEPLAGRYEIGRLIGSGGTARVYRAHDRRLHRQVAVKIYEGDAVALDQRRRLREMSIQGSITHPGVVALLDSGTDHGRTFLVMQLVEGENLAEHLLGGPMPADEVTKLAGGLAEALAHVHARRVVHRDLKPANVFLSETGPLIGDFGIAHALDTTHITGTGVVPGTAAYLAPEQVGGEPAGPPADVYALGLILLECVTGRREYPGTMIEAAMARLTRPPRIPDELPPSLAYTLRRMTRRDPADRPTAAEIGQLLDEPVAVLPVTAFWRRRRASKAEQSVEAVVAAEPTSAAHSDPRWHRWGAALGATALGEPRTRQLSAPTPAAPAEPTRRRRVLAAAGIAAVAAAALSGVLLTPHDTTTTPAQQPAPATTSAPASSAPLAESGSPAPQPRQTESADLEPAAVTRQNPVPPPNAKQHKPPPKPGDHGKGKGKGRDS